MHVHIGVLEFIIVILMVGIGNFLMRALAGRYVDTTFGQALATLY